MFTGNCCNSPQFLFYLDLYYICLGISATVPLGLSVENAKQHGITGGVPRLLVEEDPGNKEVGKGGDRET